MRQLRNALRLVNVLGRVNAVNNPKSHLHRQAALIIAEMLEKAGLNEPGEFPPVFRLKIQWYMAEVFFFCGLIHELMGLKPTDDQKRLYFISGALGAICDYLVDDTGVELEWLNSLKFPDEEIAGMNPFGSLYLAFYQEFEKLLDDERREVCLNYYSLGFDAQVRSRGQLDKEISPDAVDRICRDKSGVSFQFMRVMIDGRLPEAESQAWFELGAFVQFCNDAQDLYKDGKKGIQTFASVRPGLNEIIRDLDRQKVKAFSMIKQLDYTTEHKDRFLFILYAMTIGIYSKMHGFSKICGGKYTHEKFLSKSKEEARVNPLSISSLRYGLPRLLSYCYKTIDQAFTFSPYW